MKSNPRSLEEQVTHRFGYAAALLIGARKCCDEGEGRIDAVGLATFLLLGFSLENAFAAFLLAKKHNPADFKSHDLIRAMQKCPVYGLVFEPQAVDFVTKLSPHNKNFAFRYPEQMDVADICDLRKALQLSKQILVDVDTGLKMIGFSVADYAETL